MKNKVCRICGIDILDSDETAKGYWATDPNTPETPGSEVKLVGHGACVDMMLASIPADAQLAIKYSTFVRPTSQKMGAISG